MKKRIIVCLLAVLSLFIVTGCKKDDTPNKEIKPKEKKNIIETKVSDYDVLLDTVGDFNGMSFKFPSNAVTSNVGTYNIIDVMDNSNLVVRVAMYYFEGKYNYEVMKESPLERVGVVDSNDNVWDRYEGYQDDKYVITLVKQYNNSTYTITFLSDYDLDNFIDNFISIIEFK